MNKTFNVTLTFNNVKLSVQAKVETDLNYATPCTTEVLSVETKTGDDITELLVAFDEKQYTLFESELCKAINGGIESEQVMLLI